MHLNACILIVPCSHAHAQPRIFRSRQQINSHLDASASSCPSPNAAVFHQLHAPRCSQAVVWGSDQVGNACRDGGCDEFARDAPLCRNFLRHKTTLLSPEILVSNGVPLCHLRQTPGDFVVTFPRAYHFGFNFGLNCAESTNFALHSWLPFGRTASRCTCRGGEGLASIDMARFDAAYDPAGRSPSKRPLLNPGNPARACGTVGCTLPDFHDGACTTRLVNGQRRSTSSTSSADSSGSVSGDSSRYDVDASHGGDRSIGGSGGSGGKRKAAPPERERSGMRLQKSPRGAASQTVLRAAAVASERDGAHGRIVSSRSDDEDNDDGSRSGELSETREFSSPLSACSAGGGSLAANSGRRAGYYAPIGLINKLPPGPYVPFGDADRHRRERVKESRGGMDASAGPPMAVPHGGERNGH